MPTTSAPSDQAEKTPALKRCFGAAVLGADRIDYWIRRHMIDCAPGVPREVHASLRSADLQMPAPSPAPASGSARRSVRPPPPSIRGKPALACDRRAWRSALGRALKDEYHALSAPAPARLVALVRQLEALD